MYTITLYIHATFSAFFSFFCCCFEWFLLGIKHLKLGVHFSVYCYFGLVAYKTIGFLQTLYGRKFLLHILYMHNIPVRFEMLFFIPPANKVWGVYRNHPVRPSVRLSVRPSVRPSMYLVSATPPKRLNGFLWNFTHL